MSKEREVFISVDIEADGKIPGRNSMLSFGAVALTEDGVEHGSFSANLDTLEGAVGDVDTMKWWEGQPEAWAACRKDPQSPVNAMPNFVEWVRSMPGKPVFMAYPAAYDFMFMYWYMIMFAGESPFAHSALDIKTMAMVLLNKPYRNSTKRNMPKSWFPKGLPHNHIAIDDAREQGLLFLSMLRESRLVNHKKGG